MSAKHTPGPWRYTQGDGRNQHNGLQVWKDGHNAVASPRICEIKNATYPVYQISQSEQEANARLIAAAPDLLAEAKCAVEALDAFLAKGPGFPLSQDGICFVIRSLERAIAKAEGAL